jgi:hypothetical protein
MNGEGQKVANITGKTQDSLQVQEGILTLKSSVN